MKSQFWLPSRYAPGDLEANAAYISIFDQLEIFRHACNGSGTQVVAIHEAAAEHQARRDDEPPVDTTNDPLLLCRRELAGISVFQLIGVHFLEDIVVDVFCFVRSHVNGCLLR